MSDRRDLAIRAVAHACRVANAVQADLARVAQVLKSDRSPVTVADFAVQAIVSLTLAEGDAATPIVGEEQADVLREASQAPLLEAVVDAVRSVHPDATPDQVCDAIDRGNHDASAAAYWTLDPVDGTKGFLRGQQYAIALGLIEDGQVSIGVMGCPNLPADLAADLTVPDARGVIYAAERGAGTVEYATASRDAATRKVAWAESADAPTAIRVCESVEKAHTSQSSTALIIEHLGGVPEPVRIDSQCKYAVVARGQADAYLRLPTKPGYVERIWDHAAGSLVATEAGALVTDIHGRPLDFSKGVGLTANSGVICAAPHVHAQIIDAIAALGIKAPE